METDIGIAHIIPDNEEYIRFINGKGREAKGKQTIERFHGGRR
jgi:hypothetical protein